MELPPIGYFPTPYPDETFPGVCARFQAHMRFPSAEASRILFGTVAYPSLMPTGLGGLIRRLPAGWGAARDLITQHTLYLLYAPFVPKARGDAIYRQMAGAQKVHGILVHRALKTRTPERLRYCPACAQEDRQRYSEAYWHRIAQVFGLPICVRHMCWLEESDLTGRTRWSALWVAADEAIPDHPETRPIKQTAGTDLVIALGRSVRWLLDQPKPRFTLENLQHVYPYWLYKAGFGTYAGTVRIPKLMTHCRERAGDWAASVTGSSSWSWVERISQRSGLTRHLYRPEHHLTLLAALDLDAAEVSTAVVPEYMERPFGKGPWPCLNPVVDDRHRATARVRMTWNIDKSIGKPVARFTCACGFGYIRSGPDLRDSDRHRMSRVETVGPKWLKALEASWDDPTISSYQLAQRLRVSTARLITEARGLGLTLPRLSNTERLYASPRASRATLASRRQALLTFLREHPTANRAEVYKAMHSECEWLRRNDPEWLDAHMPALTRGVDPRRDTLLAWEILNEAREMQREGLNPTVNALENRLRRRLAARERWIDMPLTQAALDQVRAIKLRSSTPEPDVPGAGRRTAEAGRRPSASGHRESRAEVRQGPSSRHAPMP